MRFDDLVERALHVEHHRVQGAGSCDSRNRARGVVEMGEPHRLGEPARRIDGEDADSPALLRRAKGDGGRCGRLADATGTSADNDPNGGIAEDLVDMQCGGIDGHLVALRHLTPSARSRSASS